MKVAIMQPYFFPYLGYFQLMSAVDVFVVYNQIQYIKKGWMNRNRLLLNGKDKYFTVPVKKGSDFADVSDRFLADSFEKDASYIMAVFRNAYQKAPFFEETFPLLEQALACSSRNLFDFIYHSLDLVRDYLEISTPLRLSSEVDADHTLTCNDRVLSMCTALNASTYVNPQGAAYLYDGKEFNRHGFSLLIHKLTDVPYAQFAPKFVPKLSILDVLFYCGKAKTIEKLSEYTLEEK